jgi:hypothetical protein
VFVILGTVALTTHTDQSVRASHSTTLSAVTSRPGDFTSPTRQTLAQVLPDHLLHLRADRAHTGGLTPSRATANVGTGIRSNTTAGNRVKTSIADSPDPPSRRRSTRRLPSTPAPSPG